MSVWEEDDSAYSGLKCNFRPHCPWCNIPMSLFDIKSLHFSIPDGKPGANSNAIDVVMRCPECGYYDIFGVAVKDKHREALRQKVDKGIENKEFSHVAVERQET